MAKTLYIIDGHAHIYAAHFAPMRQQLSSPSGEPTKATYIFTTALLGLIEKQKPDMIAVALDCKAPTLRTTVFAEYKANRPPMPEERGQMDRIDGDSGAMHPGPVWTAEADDIIGTL
jgi:DNA polymerase-1